MLLIELENRMKNVNIVYEVEVQKIKFFFEKKVGFIILNGNNKDLGGREERKQDK